MKIGNCIGKGVTASIAIAAAVTVCRVAGAEVAAETLCFWSFSGEHGMTATKFSNEVGAQTFNATSGFGIYNLRGRKPTYDDDAPAPYVYDCVSNLTLLAANPKSLFFDKVLDTDKINYFGGYVDIADLSTALSTQEAFTVEFYFKHEESSLYLTGKHNIAFDFVSQADGLVVDTANGAPANGGVYTNSTLAKTGVAASPLLVDISASKNSSWHHLALVWSRASGTVSCYLDRALKGSAALTVSPLETSKVLRLGAGLSNREYSNFRGRLACLRVKTRALVPAEFLYASSMPPNTSGVVAFYPFKDAGVGETANVVTNVAVEGLCNGVAAAMSSGAKPVFSADRPAAYVYSSKGERRLLCANPQSLQFAASGKVTLPEMSSVLAAQGDYTIEFFFKNEDTTEWQWTRKIFAWNNGAAFPLVFLGASKATGDNQYALALANVTPALRVYKSPKGTLVDDAWHHCAVVHAALGGSCRLYLDGVESSSGAAVLASGFPSGAVDAAFGCDTGTDARYSFRGKISCLRVTGAALTPEGFLFASNRLYGNGFILTVR